MTRATPMNIRSVILKYPMPGRNLRVSVDIISSNAHRIEGRNTRITNARKKDKIVY